MIYKSFVEVPSIIEVEIIVPELIYDIKLREYVLKSKEPLTSKREYAVAFTYVDSKGKEKVIEFSELNGRIITPAFFRTYKDAHNSIIYLYEQKRLEK